MIDEPLAIPVRQERPSRRHEAVAVPLLDVLPCLEPLAHLLPRLPRSPPLGTPERPHSPVHVAGPLLRQSSLIHASDLGVPLPVEDAPEAARVLPALRQLPHVAALHLAQVLRRIGHHAPPTAHPLATCARHQMPLVLRADNFKPCQGNPRHQVLADVIGRLHGQPPNEKVIVRRPPLLRLQLPEAPHIAAELAPESLQESVKVSLPRPAVMLPLARIGQREHERPITRLPVDAGDPLQHLFASPPTEPFARGPDAAALASFPFPMRLKK